MVELPRYPRRFATSDMPTSRNPALRIGAEDIAAPFRMLGRQLDLFAGELKRAAKESPAAPLVVRNQAGLVSAEPTPVDAEETAQFARAVQMGQLAEAEERVAADLQALADEQQDQSAFSAAVRHYRAQRTKTAMGEAGRPFADALGAVIDQTAEEIWRGRTYAQLRADLEESRERILHRAAALSDDLVVLARRGAVGSPEYSRKQADYAALLREAADNPLIDFRADDVPAYVAAVERRASEAAGIGLIERVYAAQGRAAAIALVPQIAEDVAALHQSEAEQAEFRGRLEQTVEALDAEREARDLQRIRAPLQRRETVEADAAERLVAGELTDAWIDRFADQMSLAWAERVRRALHTTPPPISDPGLRFGLITQAISDGRSAIAAAIDAMIAGQLDRGSFAAIGRLAQQVTADAERRPWANDLRRSLASRVDPARPARHGAVAEFSDWLAANPEITRDEAADRADAVLRRYNHADRAVLRASLAVPAFVAGGRGDIDVAKLDEARRRLITAARAGRIDLATFSREAGLIGEWHEALIEERGLA